jgi:hypothetical protein
MLSMIEEMYNQPAWLRPSVLATQDSTRCQCERATQRDCTRPAQQYIIRAKAIHHWNSRSIAHLCIEVGAWIKGWAKVTCRVYLPR